MFVAVNSVNNSIHALPLLLVTMKHDWQGCLHFCYYSSASDHVFEVCIGHERCKNRKIILNGRFLLLLLCLFIHLEKILLHKFSDLEVCVFVYIIISAFGSLRKITESNF